MCSVLVLLYLVFIYIHTHCVSSFVSEKLTTLNSKASLHKAFLYQTFNHYRYVQIGLLIKSCQRKLLTFSKVAAFRSGFHIIVIIIATSRRRKSFCLISNFWPNVHGKHNFLLNIYLKVVCMPNQTSRIHDLLNTHRHSKVSNTKRDDLQTHLDLLGPLNPLLRLLSVLPTPYSNHIYA